MRNVLKKVLCAVIAAMCSMPFVVASSNAETKDTILAAFSYEQLDTADTTLDITYGGSVDTGYGATSGVFDNGSLLYASNTGTSYNTISWSNFDGGDGNDYDDALGNTIGAVPVMAADDENQWGDATVSPPYFEVATSTVGYGNITFSAELGGSNKGARDFALSYSINGTDYINIDNSAYSITDNKTMERAFGDVALPEDAENAESLYIRIYVTSNNAIKAEKLLSDNSAGGENAINNIKIKGVSLDGESIWQPAIDAYKSKIKDDMLTVSVKSISLDEVSAINAVGFYKDSYLTKVMTFELENIAPDAKYDITYNIADIDFDSIKVFNLKDFDDIAPVSIKKEYEKDIITATEPPVQTPEPYSNEPAYQDIPKVTLTGDITDISRDNWKDVTVTYTSKTESFTSYAQIKWQGRSSVTQGYPKYNYSIKMYTDEARSMKDKHQFKTWLPAHNYCLKANWIDSTHARNIVSARLAESIQSEALPTGATGLVDGFPVNVWLNGVDQGIYTWNIPKKDWTFGMDSDNPNHIVFGAEQQTGACLFAANSTSDNDWELVTDDIDATAAREKLNRLISFIKDSSIEDFKANFNDYFNFESVLNYYVFSHIIGHTDGFAKNMLLATFDGNIWYTSLYDMDSTYGLYWTGKKLVGADVLVRETNEDNALYRTSTLWNKFEQAFGDEIYERYVELRADELSDDKIIAEFQYFIDGIGQELYDLDESVWENADTEKPIHNYIPSRNYRLEQIKQFLTDREPYTKAWMERLRTTTE